MAIGNKIVVKFLDGSIVKGSTADFYKTRSFFELIPLDSGRPVKVMVQDLKAVFFVKSFEGRKQQLRALKHVESKSYGRRAKVYFHDGEVIEGYVQAYHENEPMFLIVPNDPTGNNERVFCNAKAVKQLTWLDAKQHVAQQKKFDIKDYL